MKTWKIMLTMTMAAVVWAGAAVAAPARLSSITTAVKTPVRVAVDTQGSLYVAEASEDRIVKYDASGKYVGAIYVSGPHSVAVDTSGNIYAGCVISSKQDGLKNIVYIYAPDFSKTGSLGVGAGEFTFPVDITIDGGGRIYVVDKDVHTVGVYDPSTRARVLTIGGFGSGNGQLSRPTSVTVNNTTGEIFVADSPQVMTTNGLTNGARISVFDKNGVFLRSFGQYGSGVGQMTSPEAMALDQAGQLYVVDSYQGAALILNPADGSSAGAGALYDNSNPMYNPSGISLSRSGLAYISSKQGAGAGLGSTDRIDVYGLDGYVTMDITPKALVFSAQQFGGNPPAQTVVISNTGSGTLNWQASTDSPWLTVGQTSGTVGPTSSAGLSVAVNISALKLGTYTGTVTVSSGFGTTQTVTVTLSVVQPPVLGVSSGWLNFSVKKGTTATPQNITLLVNYLAGTMNWSATSSASWLGVSPSAGALTQAVPSATMAVSVNTTGMGVGTYTGLITVGAPGAVGDGSKITVNLTVMPSSKIVVTTNRADATFLVSGPATYAGSGASWSMDGAPAGDYTVTYGAVAGYKKPVAQTKTLADGGEADFSATYISFADLAARKNLVLAKGPTATNDSLLKFYKGSGAPAAADLLALTTYYGATVAVGDIDGDGSAELIVGAGDGPNNPATVRIYRADRSLLLEFTPFGTLHGVRVAAADLAGDGKAEVIVSPAGGSENTGVVAVYAYDTTSGKMAPTGIELTASTNPYGANIAVADLDGNGKPYLLTAPGFGKGNPATVRVWKVDTSQGAGKWTATEVREIPLSGTYGASVAAGDVDGDGVDEIIVGTGGMASGDASLITVIKADGSQTTFKAFERYGVNVAVSDLDGDGKAEILAAAGRGTNEEAATAGAGKGKSSSKMDKRGDGKDDQAQFGGSDSESGTVRVLSGSGAVKYVLRPFENAKEGVNIAVGDLAL